MVTLFRFRIQMTACGNGLCLAAALISSSIAHALNDNRPAVEAFPAGMLCADEYNFYPESSVSTRDVQVFDWFRQLSPEMMQLYFTDGSGFFDMHPSQFAKTAMGIFWDIERDRAAGISLERLKSLMGEWLFAVTTRQASDLKSFMLGLVYIIELADNRTTFGDVAIFVNQVDGTSPVRFSSFRESASWRYDNEQKRMRFARSLRRMIEEVSSDPKAFLPHANAGQLSMALKQYGGFNVTPKAIKAADVSKQGKHNAVIWLRQELSRGLSKKVRHQRILLSAGMLAYFDALRTALMKHHADVVSAAYSEMSRYGWNRQLVPSFQEMLAPASGLGDQTFHELVNSYNIRPDVGEILVFTVLIADALELVGQNAQDDDLQHRYQNLSLAEKIALTQLTRAIQEYLELLQQFAPMVFFSTIFDGYVLFDHSLIKKSERGVHRKLPKLIGDERDQEKQLVEWTRHLDIMERALSQKQARLKRKQAHFYTRGYVNAGAVEKLRYTSQLKDQDRQTQALSQWSRQLDALESSLAEREAELMLGQMDLIPKSQNSSQESIAISNSWNPWNTLTGSRER